MKHLLKHLLRVLLVFYNFNLQFSIFGISFERLLLWQIELTENWLRQLEMADSAGELTATDQSSGSKSSIKINFLSL